MRQDLSARRRGREACCGRKSLIRPGKQLRTPRCGGSAARAPRLITSVARDGSSALFLARSMRPDFVLLDIGLPGTDGFQVAEALRREPGLAALKIIAITGRGEQDDRERSQEAGIDYYLLKPVDVPFLESLLG